MVESGELDLAFTSLPLDSRRLKYAVVNRFPMGIYLKKGHPMEKRAFRKEGIRYPLLSPGILKEESFLLPGESMPHQHTLALAIFNLIPIGSLDGGRTLYCALSLLTGPDWARRMGETLDLICAGALLGMGVLLAGTVGNITMLLAALWIIGMIFRGKSHHSPAIRTCHQGRKPVKLKIRL